MRDFNNSGEVNGDVIINSSNNGYIKFEEMNLEQLRQSLGHHQNLEKGERARRIGISLKLLVIPLIVGVLVSIWYFINGGPENAMYLISLVGVLAPLYLSFTNIEKRSDFEIRQINTINYLVSLIRERR
jgi:hypothetical protein